MDAESKKLVVDALEDIIHVEGEDLLSELADYDPPSSIRRLMAEAAANVLEAFERGQVVGKETNTDADH